MATIIDIGVVIVLLISAGVSFFRGFIREVLTIVGVIGCALAALMFGGTMVPIVRGWFGITEGQDAGKLFDIIPYEIVADISAYAGIFLVVFIVLQLASHFFSAAASAVGLGPVDRTLGVIFGLARGMLLLGILFYVFSAVTPDEYKESLLKNSATAFYLQATADWLAGFLPDGDASGETDSTREKLKAMDVLDDGKPDTENAADPAASQEDGYDAQDRQKLEGLIEKQSPEAGAKGYNE